MNKTFELTKEQLDFISFMRGKIASQPELQDRMNTCLDSLTASDENKNSGNFQNLTFYHSPRKMIEFLSLFSRDDRFKWYTHKWDLSEPFDLKSLILGQNKTKKTLNIMAHPKTSGPVINEHTYNQVWNFINFENNKHNVYSWKNKDFENIKYGWHSIVDLNNDNPDIPVENLILDDGHQFKDYVRMFKGIIEFRTDLGDEYRFSEIIWNYLRSGLPKDFSITFSGRFDGIGYDLNVYSDVIAVLSALNIMCNWMTKHKTRSSDISIDLISDDEYYILEINHKGSYLSNLEKLKNPSGDFDNLRKRLFSVCDFTIEGDLTEDGEKGGSIIVNALDADTSIQNKTLSPCNIKHLKRNIGGVKYKLKIYKRP